MKHFTAIFKLFKLSFIKLDNIRHFFKIVYSVLHRMFTNLD